MADVRDDLNPDDWAAILNAAHVRAEKLVDRLMNEDAARAIGLAAKVVVPPRAASGAKDTTPVLIA